MAFSVAPGKIGAAAWTPAAKRKSDASANVDQALIVDQHRIVGRVPIATRRNDHSSCVLTLLERSFA